MAQTIPFTCPACNTLAHARLEWIGKQVKCVKCGHVSRVPAPELGKAETVHDLPPAPPMRWEYHVVRHASGSVLRFLDELNGLGNEGWECVGVLQPGVLLYKRPRH